MWPIPILQNEVVTISFTLDTITCSWMQNNNSQTEIKAYQRYQLKHLELEKLILFNPSSIKKIITHFLNENRIMNAFVAFSLHGLYISEEYVALPMSTPTKEDFGITSSNNILWGYEYLYQNENGQFVCYTYKIPHFLLLQYKLVAIATRCNIVMITTQSNALVHCYKNIFGNTFRQSQLALDMIKNHNKPENIISTDILSKMIHIPSHICIETEKIYLATSYGLFIGQGLHV
jgi:hypothetical protein